MIKFTEKEIQEYIWSVGDDFPSLLSDPDDLELINFLDDLSDVNAKSLIRNKLFRRLKKLHHKLYGMKLKPNKRKLRNKINVYENGRKPKKS